MTPFTADLYPLFLRALHDPEYEVSSNAAFAIGSLLFQTQADLSPHYLEILGALQRLFEPIPENAPLKRDNARDNAVGAVARMILKNAEAVPLDQVLPILLGALPLKRDFAESAKTVRFSATALLRDEKADVDLVFIRTVRCDLPIVPSVESNYSRQC